MCEFEDAKCFLERLRMKTLFESIMKINRRSKQSALRVFLIDTLVADIEGHGFTLANELEENWYWT
jgi:hypothetical protein